MTFSRFGVFPSDASDEGAQVVMSVSHKVFKGRALMPHPLLLSILYPFDPFEEISPAMSSISFRRSTLFRLSAVLSVDIFTHQSRS
jgi:hypothetical protein